MGTRFVGDDLITRAIDYSPYPKRSIKGYIAAAACLLLVVAAVPVVIAKLNYSGVFSTGTERLDADKYGRTFYNMWYTEDDKIPVLDSRDYNGTILLSSSLEKLLELPHGEKDCFAVTVKDLMGADLNTVHAKFTCKYDVNDIAKNDPVCPTIYVTEEQLRSMEPVSDMCLYIDSVKRPFDQEIFSNLDGSADNLKNEKFTKFYGEIYLNYDKEDAMRTLGLNPEEASSQDPAVLAELERYYRKFAADYKIDPDKLFAGGVTRTLAMYHCLAFPDLSEEEAREMNFVGYRTDVVLYGEFETAAALKMLRDKRVNFIMKSSDGSYIYEERGLWSYPAEVSEEKISVGITSGMTYGEIVKTLGHTAQYGCNSLHVYLAAPGETESINDYGIIILDFDDPNEICPYSGAELLENAVHFDIKPAYSSEWSVNAIMLKDDLCLYYDEDSIRPVRLELKNIGGPDGIIYSDGNPVSEDKRPKPGTKLHVYGQFTVYNNDSSYHVFPSKVSGESVIVLDELIEPSEIAE